MGKIGLIEKIILIVSNAGLCMCREALLACEVVQGKTFNQKILILKIIFHIFLWREDDQGVLREEALKSKIFLQSFDIVDVLKR